MGISSMLLYGSIAIIFYWYFYIKTKDKLNPFGIFLLCWYFSAAIATMYLSPLQQTWSLEMHLVVFLSGISFFLGAFIFVGSRRFNKQQIKLKCNKTYIYLTRFIFVVALCSFIIELHYNDWIFALLAHNQVGDVKSIIQAIPVIHYGVILLPFCAIFSIYELLVTKKSIFYNTFVLFIAMVNIILFQLSRGFFLILFLAFIFLININQKISFKKLAILTIILTIIMSAIFLVRVKEGSLVYELSGGSIWEDVASPIYFYVSMGYENLRKLVEMDLSYHLTLDASFAFLWRILGIQKYTEVKEIQTLFFNQTTYLYGFYHDLKIFGIIFFPFIIAIILSFLYRWMYINSYFVILLAVLQKAIFFPFFGNYFFGNFITLWPYIVCFIVILIASGMKLPNIFITSQKI